MISSRLAIEVFCSYAPQDEKYCQQLTTHVSPLKRQGLISFWHDQHILPGANRTGAINEHLERGSIILLLISADFINSDYSYGSEMKRALERHESDEARVIPIIVRPCDWQQLPFASLQPLPVDGKPISQWTSKDEAWTQIVAGLRHMIEDLSLLEASAPRSYLPPIWMVPYPRNPFFLGRNDLLSQIHFHLQAGQTTAHPQPQTISGLGGIGKTQIATEYAYRYAQEYQMVLWARAESIDTLNASYVQIAAILNLPEKDAQEQQVVIGAVKTWLQCHHTWLLILDNADELTLLSNFLPPALGGHLLITTRASATGRFARRIEVHTFTEEQGALFLLRRASRLAPDDPLTQASEQNQTIARAIANELGGLPLALDQAGSYLEQTNYSLSDYQQIYQQHRKEMLNERGHSVNEDHPDPIATTWSLSFARVEQKSSVGAEVLRLCAFLSADAIPLALMTAGENPVVQDTFALGRAIDYLRSYSLVSHDPATRTLSIHRLVQAVLRDGMPTEIVRQWKRRAVLVVEAACPDVQEVKQWDICEQWLPHALVCATWIDQEQMTNPEAVRLLNAAGHYLKERARYHEAEPLYLRALAICEEQLGNDNPDTARSLNNLALLYHDQGKYAQAEALYQRALAIHERTPETEALNIATVMNNLALVYDDQARYRDSEPLCEQALNIQLQFLGTKHVRVAMSINNLAGTYRRLGKYEQAEALLLQALSIHEELTRPYPLSLATTLDNLAGIYRRQGNHIQAEALFVRALTIRKEVLGIWHPDVATCLSNLGVFNDARDQHEQARPLHEQALAIYKQTLAPNHPYVAICLSNLAIHYYELETYVEAEQAIRLALEVDEQVLGTEHPGTACDLNILAVLLSQQGKYTQAEHLYKRILVVFEQALGRGHSHVAHSLNNLAILYYLSGKPSQARPLYQRALVIYWQTWKAPHPEVLTCLHNLAKLFPLGEFDVQAISSHQEVINVAMTLEVKLAKTPPKTKMRLPLCQLCGKELFAQQALYCYICGHPVNATAPSALSSVTHGSYQQAVHQSPSRPVRRPLQQRLP
jgi:tetratricopeptide (TPR) repeat protein